ncbi:MAG: T9SS type A sorting domain-containing protein [Saprospiraceae bacterium]
MGEFYKVVQLENQSYDTIPGFKIRFDDLFAFSNPTCTTYVNTNDVEVNNTTHLFPNPTSGIFYYSLDYKNVNIFTVAGSIICHGSAGKFDLSNYPPGVYILKGEYEKNVCDQKNN